MIRFGLLLIVGLVASGCSTSRKIVVQDGYRGISQPPAGIETKQAGDLSMVPETRSDVSAGPSQPAPQP